MGRSTRAGFWARLLVSLGLLAALLALVDRATLGRRLAGAQPLWVAVAAGLVTLDRLLMAGKWWLLLRGRQGEVSLWGAVRGYYVASFAGLFLPMTVGADAVRVALLAGQGPVTGLVASVVLERLVGALAQGLLATVALGVLLAAGPGGELGPGVGAALLLAVAGALAAFPVSFRLARVLAARAGWGGWRGAVGRLAAAYATYAGARALVGAFLALTLLEGGFPVAYHYAAGRALGLDPGWHLFVATVPLAFLLARLPVSLGGIGVLETAFVYLAGLMGLARTDAFALALLAEAVVLVALLPGAALYLVPATATAPARAR